MRKIVCLIGAVLLLASLSVCASAEEYTGSFRIAMNVGDLAVTNGAFTVYRVGIRISDGYRITDEFGGGFVNLEDAQSPHLAQWLAENNADSGRTLLLDADGNAVFSQLGEGLYLIAQTEKTDGFYPIQPFLMTVPCDGRWDIPINVDPLPIKTISPETGEEDVLLLGVLGMAGSAMGIALCTARRKKEN